MRYEETTGKPGARATLVRPTKFSTQLDAETRALLDAYAREREMSVAAALRKLIREGVKIVDK